MNFLKALFGSEQSDPDEDRKNDEERKFDLLKYDGVKAMKIGRFDYALKCFEEALQLHDDLEVRDYLSRSLVQTGDYEGAVEQLRVLVEAQPQNAALPLQAAHVSFLMEDYDAMSKWCERSLAISDDNAQAHFFYARACLGLKDMIGAIAHLTKCLAVDENYGDAYLLRAQTLFAMGDVGSAEADVQWLTEHAQAHEDVLLLSARIEYKKGNSQRALELYDQVTEVNPFHIDAYRERGALHFETGDKDGAKEDMEKVLELNPELMASVNGDFQAEGIEQKVKRAYSALNPFGLWN